MFKDGASRSTDHEGLQWRAVFDKFCINLTEHEEIMENFLDARLRAALQKVQGELDTTEAKRRCLIEKRNAIQNTMQILRTEDQTQRERNTRSSDTESSS